MLLAELQQQSGEDVLCAHHQHNGFPCAPSPEWLHSICNQKHVSARHTSPTIAGNTEGSMAADSQSSPVVACTQTIAPDGSLEGNATKLWSYPFGFHQVIEQAKLIAQCDSTTKNPFPPQSPFLDVSATEVFNEALCHDCDNPTCHLTPPLLLHFSPICTYYVHSYLCFITWLGTFSYQPLPLM